MRPPAPVRDVAPAVRKSMKGNKGKDTKPELLVRRRLRQAGPWRLPLQWNVPAAPISPIRAKRYALFINGCFWHRCPHCKPSMPKTNREYWIPKFERNVERDRRNIALLEQDGWRVHVIWECQLKKKVVDETFAELIPVLESELANC